MKSFAFVRNADLRQNLTRDYTELLASRNAKAWKAVHVLAGSMVEAVLADFVDTSGVAVPKGKSAFDLSLGELIDLCVNHKFFERYVSELASVVRNYRNLIHPGRAVRLSEEVSEETAQIAISLVDIVLRKIEHTYSKIVGYDAEQFVSKIVRDDEVMGIVDHLIAELKPVELRRSTLDLIPKRYFELMEDRGSVEQETLATLRGVFRSCWKKLPPEDKVTFHENFADRIRRGDQGEIRNYANAFYRCVGLEAASEKTRRLILDYIKHRLSNTSDSSASSLCYGFADCADGRDFDEIARALVSRAYVRLDYHAYEVLSELFWVSTPNVKRLDEIRESVAKTYDKLGKAEIAARIRKEEFGDIPF